MGNKTSKIVVNDTFASEYFLPSADYNYPMFDFSKDNGCGGDDGYAEVLDPTKRPVAEEGPYLVTDLLFDRPRVSHTSCLFVESSFIFFARSHSAIFSAP